LQRDVILRLSQVAFNSAQKGAGRHTKPGGTGALFQSLFNRPSSETVRTVGHDQNRAPHAKFVIQGTKAHDIRPNKKKALRWVSGNNFVFAKFVRHPGYIGDAYMDQASDDAMKQFQTILDESIARHI
jgi:hypothetical protein